METIPPISLHSVSGEWKRVGDLDTTGGPPHVVQSDGSKKDNPKFCQNPQYHLQIMNPYGKDEIYLKIVLRKHEHRHSSKHHSSSSKHGSGGTNSGSNAAASEEKRANATMGLVVCKADVLDENVSKGKKKAPRQNKLGEVRISRLSICLLL
jgi:hypothetical protein